MEAAVLLDDDHSSIEIDVLPEQVCIKSHDGAQYRFHRALHTHGIIVFVPIRKSDVEADDLVRDYLAIYQPPVP